MDLARAPAPDPSALIARLAAGPREAGTPGAAAARELVAAHLRSLGYTVEIQRFRFSPSTLWALPLAGAGIGGLGVLLVPLLAGPAPRGAALLVWLLGAASVAGLAWGVGAGWVSLPFGGGPREDANLIATRGPAVRRWLVAHLDTKAQGHSMAGRLAAVWALVSAAVALTALGALRWWGPVPLPLAAAAALLAVGAGASAGRGRLRGSSAGARDNASGLLAALEAAATRDAATGVLITGAEEFGLVGARIFARATPDALAGTDVINFDTLDDTGPLAIVRHDDRASALARDLTEAVRELDLPIRVRRLPLGILVDSIPLARVGARAVTVARLSWATLRLIHTPSDHVAGFAFRTAGAVGRAVAARLDRSAI